MTWPFNQIWTEGINFPGNMHTVEINADSYNAWVRDVCLVADPKDLTDDAFEAGTQNEDLDEAEYNNRILKWARDNSDMGWIPKPTKLRGVQNLGDGWRFAIQTLAYYDWGAVDWLQLGLKRNRLAVYEDQYGCFSQGAAMFTGPVHVPMLLRGNQPWMSLTPMEIYTLREPLRVAKGHVLVAGLGMGWLTRRILENPDVTHVTQVEINPTIIDFFGSPLKEMFGDKVDFIEANVYDLIKGKHNCDTYIFDIWQKVTEATEDNAFQSLKEELGCERVWGWADGDLCDDDEPEYEDQDEDEFPNDQACWGKEDPTQWWGIRE